VYETTRCRRYAEPFHEIDTGLGTPFHCTSDYSSGNKPTDPVASDPLRRRTRENNTCILVVERSAVDGDRMVATLRVLFGYQTRIDRTFSVPEAVAQLATGMPTILLLGDTGNAADGAADDAALLAAMAQLRTAGYEGPVIAITGLLSRSRRARLLSAGAIDAFHKDELCSERITQALRRSRVGRSNSKPRED